MGIQSTGNVFFDLGFSPAESPTLLIKSPNHQITIDAHH